VKIVNEKLLAEYRGIRPCWWCGLLKLCQAHHLVTKGMGGSRRADVPLNLAALCWEDHQAHHDGNNPTTADLIAVVAARNDVQQADVESALCEIKWGKGNQYG
jgi:hypothetical protein